MAQDIGFYALLATVIHGPNTEAEQTVQTQTVQTQNPPTVNWVESEFD